jgi:hypothetical protein
MAAVLMNWQPKGRIAAKVAGSRTDRMFERADADDDNGQREACRGLQTRMQRAMAGASTRHNAAITNETRSAGTSRCAPCEGWMICS